MQTIETVFNDKIVVNGNLEGPDFEIILERPSSNKVQTKFKIVESGSSAYSELIVSINIKNNQMVLEFESDKIDKETILLSTSIKPEGSNAENK